MYSTYYDLNYCGLLSVALAKDSEPPLSSFELYNR